MVCLLDLELSEESEVYISRNDIFGTVIEPGVADTALLTRRLLGPGRFFLFC